MVFDGEKMSKSLGNNVLVTDLVDKGFSPMALRYLILTSHYRKGLNFTWSSIAGAQSAYDKLAQFVRGAKGERKELSQEKLKKLDGFRTRFMAAVNEDMGWPGALAGMWEMIKSNIPDYDKADQLLDWDQILGLGLAEIGEDLVPEEVKRLGQDREQLRRAGKYVEADGARMKVEKLGWTIEDTKMGSKFKHAK